MIKIKQTILNWCFRQVFNNLRALDARQLCELKFKLHAFNCTSDRWVDPGVKKAKDAE